MHPAEIIEHEGVVVKATDEGAEVEIITGTACSGCHAKSACSIGESEAKIISIRSARPLTHGDRVTVTMEQSLGFRAIALGYVIPFAVLVTSFVAATVAGAGELLSALLSFAAVGIYYFILWMLREKFEKKFEFKIKI